MAPKREPKSIRCGDTFGSLFATFSEDRFFMHFGRPLAHFWHPWASKWLTFGSRWLPFGSLLAPFGSLLAPFGSLWLTFGHPFRGDSENFHKFPYIFMNLPDWLTIFLRIFMFFATPLLKNMYFRKHPRILICSGNPFRKKPQNAKGTPTENTSSFVASLQGPGAEHLPLAT